MGVFDKLLGKGPQFEPLDPQSKTATELQAHREQIEALGKAARDRLEVIPRNGSLYVFVGKPPKAFGLVWYHDGQEQNFKRLVEEQGVSYAAVQRLADALREAYTESNQEPRFSYELGAQPVVVTPSDNLAEKIEAAIAITSN